MSDVDVVAALEAARPKLMAIAYRMLGSVAEAEDVVGDVAERWAAADRSSIDVPEAWMVTVTTRRALDVARSARVQRESYPGEWLPEPVATGSGPGDDLERHETLTMGFLLLLERLTPIERAVLVLHDVMEYPYDVVAGAVGRSQAACRQALHRARRHVTVPRPSRADDRAQAERIADRFIAATISGDFDALLAMLAPDVVMTSDGGGFVHAAMRPVHGRSRVLRLLGGLARNVDADSLLVPDRINGEAALIAHAAAGWAVMVVSVEGNHVTQLRLVVNPAKLERLLATRPDIARHRPGPWEGAGRFRHRGGTVLDGLARSEDSAPRPGPGKAGLR